MIGHVIAWTVVVVVVAVMLYGLVQTIGEWRRASAFCRKWPMGLWHVPHEHYREALDDYDRIRHPRHRP